MFWFCPTLPAASALPVSRNVRFVLKEVDILGSRNALPEDFRAVIHLLESGRFPVSDVITSTVPLSSACEMLQQWSDSPADFTKIHVEMQ